MDLEAQAQSGCERYGLENVSVKIKGPSNYVIGGIGAIIAIIGAYLFKKKK